MQRSQKDTSYRPVTSSTQLAQLVNNLRYLLVATAEPWKSSWRITSGASVFVASRLDFTAILQKRRHEWHSPQLEIGLLVEGTPRESTGLSFASSWTVTGKFMRHWDRRFSPTSSSQWQSLRHTFSDFSFLRLYPGPIQAVFNFSLLDILSSVLFNVPYLYTSCPEPFSLYGDQLQLCSTWQLFPVWSFLNNTVFSARLLCSLWYGETFQRLDLLSSAQQIIKFLS